MSEDIEREEEEVQEIQETEQEEREAQPSEAETKAREMGWVPKEQFRGDPDRWVDADEFVKRGENMVPILKERLNHALGQIREMRETFEEFKEYATKREQKRVEKAIKELEQRRREAVESGDVEAFDQVDKEYRELNESMREEPKKAPQKADEPPTADPVVKEWTERNPWFNKDQDAADFAVMAEKRISAENPGMPLSEVLEKVTERVRKRFPEHFENPRRNQPGAVEGGTQAGRGKGKKTYADLPADAKAHCDRFVKQGLLTREAYVQDYFGE